MSVSNSLLVALLVMGIVFVVLIVLSLLLKAQSKIFSFIDKNNKPSATVEIENKGDCNSSYIQNTPEVSKGQLSLIGVDEKTAAIIMAIVSDELKISLNELQFQSIKSLD
jgi:Na+-transporting methylmalonyl-CoA/oxaloacetate decarboxylase gamma subunit